MRKKITTEQKNQKGKNKHEGGYKPRGSQPKQKPPPKRQPSGGEKEKKK